MKYWAYVNNEILGPFEKEKLLELPSFSPSLLICPQTPVGEKTEDWKDASSYPEISAIMSPGAPKAAAPAPQAAAITPAPAASQPLGGSGVELKPLTASSVEPVPPTSDHSFGQINLEVGHLERSDRMSPSQAAAASAFDPITLSSIGRKAGTLSGADATGGKAPEGIAREPQPAIGTPAQAPAPAEIPAIAPAPAAVDFPSIAPAPAMQAPQEAFAPVPAAAAPMAGGPALDELNRKIEIMAANTVSRQDLSQATDPLRMKLEQMGEVLSSMKNSQFQREIMDKLGYLENAISDIKFSMKEGGGKPAAGGPAPDRAVPGPGKLTFEPNSATMFGAQPEKAKAEPAPEEKPKTFGIVDEGVKPPKFKGMISGFIRKMTQVLLTLGLLLAVLLVTVFALKVANVFDATKYIPFKIPFLSSPEAAPGAQPELPSEVPQQVEGAQATPQAEAKKEPDVSPEVVYFARYYAPKPGGPKLEDKITEVAAASGATYSPSNWTARATSTSTYEALAIVPGKSGDVTFTFAVDFAKKTISPMDDKAKAAFEALIPPAPAPKAGGKRGKKGAAAAAPAPKAKAAAAKKPAAKKAAAPKPAADEEYEYVDEEEAGQ